jgi:hypothetical protein
MHLYSKIALLLTLAFTLPAAPNAFAEDESDDESFTEDAGDVSLEFEQGGDLKIDGQSFKERGPVTTFLYAEVEKSVPAPGGDMVLYLKPMEFRQPNRKNVSAMEAVKVDGDVKPFVYTPEWKMYDANGRHTDDPNRAFRVLIPAPTEGDALTFDVKWNECEGSITGNFNGYSCSKNRFLSDDFAAYLKANLFDCVQAGLDRVGGGALTKVHVLHNGTAGDGKHSKKSLHAAGRAVDIKVLRVTGIQQRKDFSFEKSTKSPKGVERRFYLGFRQCWHNKQEKRRCPPKKDIGGTGTIGWEDSRHQHHLHVSMPYCPNNKGWFITDDDYIRAGKKAGRMPASKKKK